MAQPENFTIDIAATFQSLWGYVPAPIPSLASELEQLSQPAGRANPYNIATTAAQRYRQPQGGLTPLYDKNITDMIGREVFMPITLNVNDPYSGTTSYYFPFSLMSLHNRKLIKETPMVQRGGSVIEEIGVGPWELEIKGFIVDPNDQFPDNQLIGLQRLYTANQVTETITTVGLECALSDIFLGAKPNVVITELEIPAKAKVIGVRDFSMRLIQDSVLTLYPSQQTNVTVDPSITAALANDE